MKKDFKISGFKTPENYFANFDTPLFGRIEEERFPKSTGFKVPDGYFATLEGAVLSEIVSKKQKKVIPLFPRKYFGYAAAVAACLVIGITVSNFNQNKSTLDSIHLSLIDKYIEEGNLNLDLYELTTYLEPSEIGKIDFENHYISQTNLKDYLLENTEEGILLDEGY